MKQVKVATVFQTQGHSRIGEGIHSPKSTYIKVEELSTGISEGRRETGAPPKASRRREERKDKAGSKSKGYTMKTFSVSCCVQMVFCRAHFVAHAGLRLTCFSHLSLPSAGILGMGHIPWRAFEVFKPLARLRRKKKKNSSTKNCMPRNWET